LALAGALVWPAMLAAQPTTEPAGSAEVSPGLKAYVYRLQRRPLEVRRLPPGTTPVAILDVASAEVSGGRDLAGHDLNLQAELVGELHVPADGVYAFHLDSDDGAIVEIAGREVVRDKWVNGSKPPSIGSVELPAGWVPLRAQLFQGDGGMRLSLRWKPPGADDFAAIPADAFRVRPEQLADRPASTQPTTRPAEFAYRAIYDTRGYAELRDADAELLMDLLEGPTQVSIAARKDLASGLELTNYAKLPYWHQVKYLTGFVRSWFYGSTTRRPPTRRASHEIADAVAVEYDGWRGAKRQGYKHVATIEGHTLTIYTPAADSVEREFAARAVASLPAELRVLVRQVITEPYGTASEFNGGGSDIWIRLRGPATQESLDSTFAHEIGHLLMHRVDGYTRWEAAAARDTLSVSHYGRSNPSEDFAEFTRLYLDCLHDESELASLRVLFPNRTKQFEEELERLRQSAD
jgi:hypothetical protein